ncbi:MAG: CRISPR-associated endonuclease Cas2 [Thermoplasmata archaeon]|jgi:CRISPR-associated protein Cas2
MYVILVYDVDVARVNKINKYLKRYLIWIQNSVFEGEINNTLYERMLEGIKKIISENDSIVIYKFQGKTNFERTIIGKEKSEISNVI